MTEKEAIEYLEITKTCSEDNSVGELQKQMCDMAIKALEEIQQYRLIKSATIGEIAEVLKEFSAIGTVEECREAMEKQKPKKPVPINYKEYENKIVNADFLEGLYLCPNCKTAIRSGSHCDRCGQKLNRSEEE